MSTGAFWDFLLAVYERPGVAELCLELQDRWQLDVNMLLFSLHTGEHGHALTSDELCALDAAAAPWRDNVVRPLRTARRWLKAGASAAVAAQAVSLRRQVQVAELAAEHCQQLAMAQSVPLHSRHGEQRLHGAHSKPGEHCPHAVQDGQDVQDVQDVQGVQGVQGVHNGRPSRAIAARNLAACAALVRSQDAACAPALPSGPTARATPPITPALAMALEALLLAALAPVSEPGPPQTGAAPTLP